MNMEVGDQVIYRNLKGVVKYVGGVHYAKGDWVGGINNISFSLHTPPLTN